MSGVLAKCSPIRWLHFLGLNPNDADDHALDQFLSLLCPNDREVALAKSLEARSPVSGAVPRYVVPTCFYLVVYAMGGLGSKAFWKEIILRFSSFC